MVSDFTPGESRYEKSPKSGFLVGTTLKLLELRFLINHMLTSNRVILGNFHLTRACTLVFGRRIEVTRTSGRL